MGRDGKACVPPQLGFYARDDARYVTRWRLTPVAGASSASGGGKPGGGKPPKGGGKPGGEQAGISNVGSSPAPATK